MTKYVKFEEDGWFYLSGHSTERGTFSDDLGRGGGETITRFRSAETREYFLQAQRLHEELHQVVHEREALVASLREALKKKRGLRKWLEGTLHMMDHADISGMDWLRHLEPPCNT